MLTALTNLVNLDQDFHHLRAIPFEEYFDAEQEILIGLDSYQLPTWNEPVSAIQTNFVKLQLVSTKFQITSLKSCLRIISHWRPFSFGRLVDSWKAALTALFGLCWNRRYGSGAMDAMLSYCFRNNKTLSYPALTRWLYWGQSGRWTELVNGRWIHMEWIEESDSCQLPEISGKHLPAYYVVFQFANCVSYKRSMETTDSERQNCIVSSKIGHRSRTY